MTAGTAIGEVGNSGTTYVPHLHVVFGFTNGSGRFWSLPVDWADVQHRYLQFPVMMMNVHKLSLQNIDSILSWV